MNAIIVEDHVEERLALEARYKEELQQQITKKRALSRSVADEELDPPLEIVKLAGIKDKAAEMELQRARQEAREVAAERERRLQERRFEQVQERFAQEQARRQQEEEKELAERADEAVRRQKINAYIAQLKLQIEESSRRREQEARRLRRTENLLIVPGYELPKAPCKGCKKLYPSSCLSHFAERRAPAS